MLALFWPLFEKGNKGTQRGEWHNNKGPPQGNRTTDVDIKQHTLCSQEAHKTKILTPLINSSFLSGRDFLSPYLLKVLQFIRNGSNLERQENTISHRNLCGGCEPQDGIHSNSSNNSRGKQCAWRGLNALRGRCASPGIRQRGSSFYAALRNGWVVVSTL